MAQGRGHPGQATNPSINTIPYTLNTFFRDTNQPTTHVFKLGQETFKKQAHMAKSDYHLRVV